MTPVFDGRRISCNRANSCKSKAPTNTRANAAKTHVAATAPIRREASFVRSIRAHGYRKLATAELPARVTRGRLFAGQLGPDTTCLQTLQLTSYDSRTQIG